MKGVVIVKGRRLGLFSVEACVANLCVLYIDGRNPVAGGSIL